MNDHETRVRSASIYFPSAATHPHGYGNMDMRRREPTYINSKSDYPYSQMHSRTPAWEGKHLSEIANLLPRNNRIINLRRGNQRNHRYDATRLTIFINDASVITSLMYA